MSDGVNACRRRSRGDAMRRLLLLLLLSCATCVAAAATAEAHERAGHAPYTVTTTTTTRVLESPCPRCPLCDAHDVPLTTWLRYCDAVSTTAQSLFATVATHALAFAPLRRQHTRHVAACYPNELPFATNAAVREAALRNAHELLHTRLVGQPHVVRALLPLLRRKLTMPSDPLVLHFAGDNGVGKTYTARLVSLALSLRCAAARSACDTGDALLIVPGTGFDGVPVATARRRIVALVTRHMRRYPHGVVLIDDMTAMSPPLVSALAPLFGRGTHFPEQLVAQATEGDDNEDEDEDEEADNEAAVSKGTEQRTDADNNGSSNVAAAVSAAGDDDDKAHRRRARQRRRRTAAAARTPVVLQTRAPESVPSLSQLLVIVTTDFGKEGRTRGLSVRDIELLVRREFAEVYGTLLPSYTRTFAFLPFTAAVAEEMVHAVVTTLPCVLLLQQQPSSSLSHTRYAHATTTAATSAHALHSSTITPLAASFLVEQHRATWQHSEHGHALRRVIEDELVTQLVDYHARHGHDRQLAAHFVLDTTQHRVVLRNLLGGDGDDDDGRGEVQSDNPDGDL